jgi:hypothetical protein
MLIKQIDQTNKGTRYKVIPCARIFATVTRKLILPKIDPIPDTCRLKIAKSTDAPEWLNALLRGGYAVHPTPGPCSTRALKTYKVYLIGNSRGQKMGTYTLKSV